MKLSSPLFTGNVSSCVQIRKLLQRFHHIFPPQAQSIRVVASTFFLVFRQIILYSICIFHILHIVALFILQKHYSIILSVVLFIALFIYCLFVCSCCRSFLHSFCHACNLMGSFIADPDSFVVLEYKIDAMLTSIHPFLPHVGLSNLSNNVNPEWFFLLIKSAVTRTQIICCEWIFL